MWPSLTGSTPTGNDGDYSLKTALQFVHYEKHCTKTLLSQLMPDFKQRCAALIANVGQDTATTTRS